MHLSGMNFIDIIDFELLIIHRCVAAHMYAIAHRRLIAHVCAIAHIYVCNFWV
jgi:hypothetical protein